MADDLEQRIRERAYEIWENEGCPEGRGDEHWRLACAEYEEARAEAAAENKDAAVSTNENKVADATTKAPPLSKSAA